MRVDARAIGPLEANCYIVDGHIMIDPGDDTAELDSFIADTGATIRAAVLTHGHFDHMLGAAHIKRVYGAKIYVSKADAHYLKDESAALVFGMAETPFEPVEADAYLEAGLTDIDGTAFEVLLTPGHTPGGVCLLSRENKLVFTGDTLFRFGYGRTDLPGGNMRELYGSLRSLLKLPDDIYVCPGHGEGATMGEIKQGRPI